MSVHCRGTGKHTRTKRDNELLTAIADYMCSEGCGCCRHQEAHDEAAANS